MNLHSAALAAYLEEDVSSRFEKLRGDTIVVEALVLLTILHFNISLD